MFVGGALFFLGHLTITAWTQNSFAIVTTSSSSFWRPPSLFNGVNDQAGALSSINYNIATKPEALMQTDEYFPHRIVGGQKISIREAPWQVVIFGNGFALCGGSILNRYWVLTAAHCVIERVTYTVRAGSKYYKSGGQFKSVRKAIFNNGYNTLMLNNDIALLKMKTPFQFTSYVQPVKLAGVQSKLPKQYFITGWGLTSENGINLSRVLRRVQVKPVNRKTCARAYGYKIITKKMICAAAPQKDSCSGDSGGPLFYSGIQYGIVSFGEGCARQNFPGVYTDVRKFREFISYVMRRY